MPSRTTATVFDLPRLPQQARSRAKREQLLAAALTLFAEHGFDATTVDTIAATAGVSVGIFYRYFRSKSQLLLALLQERLEEVRLNLAGLPGAALDVETLAGELRRYLRRERQFVPLQRARQELLLRHPELAEPDRRQFLLMAADLGGHLDRGRAAGRLRGDLDPAATAQVVLLLAAQLRTLLPHRTDAELEPVIHAAAQMIQHALLPD